jgi:hypothetical protein
MNKSITAHSKTFAKPQRECPMFRIAICLSGLLLASCAQVTFHPGVPGSLQQADLATKTGLKYYYAKPYVLVSYTGAKDSPVKIDLVSLPDLEHPTYAVYHPGWGQHIFSLAVGTNGTLSSYGQTADSKGPETISAIGSLLSGAGAGASGAGALYAAIHPQSEHPDPIALIGNAESSLKAILSDENQKKPDFQAKGPLVPPLLKSLKDVKSALQKREKGQQEALTTIAGTIEKDEFPEPAKGDAETVNGYFETAKSFVKAAADALNGTPSAATPKPDFRLFEIRMEAGVTKLIPVDTATARMMIQQVASSYGK